MRSRSDRWRRRKRSHEELERPGGADEKEVLQAGVGEALMRSRDQEVKRRRKKSRPGGAEGQEEEEKGRNVGREVQEELQRRLCSPPGWRSWLPSRADSRLRKEEKEEEEE